MVARQASGQASPDDEHVGLGLGRGAHAAQEGRSSCEHGKFGLRQQGAPGDKQPATTRITIVPTKCNVTLLPV